MENKNLKKNFSIGKGFLEILLYWSVKKRIRVPELFSRFSHEKLLLNLRIFDAFILNLPRDSSVSNQFLYVDACEGSMQLQLNVKFAIDAKGE